MKANELMDELLRVSPEANVLIHDPLRNESARIMRAVVCDTVDAIVLMPSNVRITVEVDEAGE